MWHTMDGMGWWMVIGSVWFVFFWALVIWAVVKVGSRFPNGSGQPDALELAKRRYARGEISREDYERLRSDLRG